MDSVQLSMQDLHFRCRRSIAKRRIDCVDWTARVDPKVLTFQDVTKTGQMLQPVRKWCFASFECAASSIAQPASILCSSSQLKTSAAGGFILSKLLFVWEILRCQLEKGPREKNWDQSTFAPNFATFQYLDILGCKFCPPVVHLNPSTVLGLVVHIPPIRNFLTRKLFSPTCLSSLLSTLRLRMRMETQIPTLCPMHALSMQTEDGDENWNRSQNLECHSFSSTCPCQFVGHRSSKVFLAHIGIVPSVIVWGAMKGEMNAGFRRRPIYSQQPHSATWG